MSNPAGPSGQGQGQGQSQGQRQGRQQQQQQQRKPFGVAPNRNQYRRRQDAPLVLPTTEKVLVIDLEATCWESNEAKPAKEENEIIEVGWALLDVPTNALVRTGTLLVKPIHSRVSAFCTQLTTITKEMVETEGVTLKEAFDFLVGELGSKSVSWVSYGEYISTWAAAVRGVWVEHPFGEADTNVKTVFKEVYRGQQGNYGVATAYKAVMGKPTSPRSRRPKEYRDMFGALLLN